MALVEVNRKQSEAIGQIVGKQKFKPSFLKRSFLNVDLPKDLKANMYFFAVGICHQTYHLANPKLNLYGWDFLEYGFIQLAHEKPQLLDAHFLIETETRELKQLIGAYFAEDNNPQKCTLDRLDERIRLWKDMAQYLLSYSGNFLRFIDSSEKQSRYFYQNLVQTEAYSDPLQKKTSFLMKLLEDAQLISWSQSEELIPIMDYHMQRVLLRSGCVEIQDKELREKIVGREAIEDDSEIRSACIDSMKMIARESGMSVLKMNDIFYTMGRSCCHEKPICISHQCEKTPCTLSLAIDIPEKHNCIFEEVCKGATDENFRQYWQPMVETHFY